LALQKKKYASALFSNKYPKKAAAPIEIIAEPGKAKATGKPDPREIAIKIINNAKNKSSID
jgi:hypothetical protein